MYLTENCKYRGTAPDLRRIIAVDELHQHTADILIIVEDIYNSLLNTQSSDRADTYFILKDFRSYAEAHRKIDQAYRDEKWWARTAMLNTASAGKFSSDRTIEEYVRDIWHLKKIKVELK